MAKKKYGVTCTLIYNGFIEVEAENEDEAFELANEKIANDGYPGKINDDFDFGEVTADYVDEL